ncbi:MAG: hypothetical protein JXA15_13790 [Spirochaetales bacterium]|nr:hypothetical protein [Spirochaetales bacterium]
MPWKLIVFIVAVALILAFVGFNLENSADVSLIFVTFSAVPVYVTMLSSFLLGLAAAIPFAIRSRRRPARESRPPAPTGETRGKKGVSGKSGKRAGTPKGEGRADQPEPL